MPALAAKRGWDHSFRHGVAVPADWVTLRPNQLRLTDFT